MYENFTTKLSPKPGRMPDKKKKKRGFTFAELLAAMVFMALVIPVSLQGIMIANRAGETAKRKEIAAQLAEHKLQEMILLDTWRYGNREGGFGDNHPGFQWKLTEEVWDQSTVKLLTIFVSYVVQDRESFITLSTLVDDSEEDEPETNEVEES